MTSLKLSKEDYLLMPLLFLENLRQLKAQSMEMMKLLIWKKETASNLDQSSYAVRRTHYCKWKMSSKKVSWYKLEHISNFEKMRKKTPNRVYKQSAKLYLNILWRLSSWYLLLTWPSGSSCLVSITLVSLVAIFVGLFSEESEFLLPHAHAH